jgi:hypothetical protein
MNQSFILPDNESGFMLPEVTVHRGKESITEQSSLPPGIQEAKTEQSTPAFQLSPFTLLFLPGLQPMEWHCSQSGQVFLIH